MSTHPSSETAPKQGAPTRKAIPPRALLISGVLAAAVIGTAGYFATRPPTAPAVLTTTPVTVPAPITSTPSTQDTATPPVSTGLTPNTPPVREITVTSPAVIVTTPAAPVVIPSSTPTAGSVPAVQTPVPAPASAPALNVTQQWLQDHQVTYGGRADSGENTTVILNTNEGQVFVDVGQVIPGTEVTLTSADNQNLVFTQKSKTAKLTIPAFPTTDTGAQP